MNEETNHILAQIRRSALQVRATDFKNSADYLKAVYMDVKKKVGGFSYRSFAEALGYGPTNYLHLVCTGKRKITLKASSELAIRLALKGNQKKYFELLVARECSHSTHEKEVIFEKLIELKHKSLPQNLERDMMEYLSEWYYPVVRELATLAEFQPDPDWISLRVYPRITHEQAVASLLLLRRIGFLVDDQETGRCLPRNVHITTGSLVQSLSATRYHQIMMELARNALLEVPPQKRDFQALTFAVSSDLLEDIKSDTEQFWKMILAKSESCAEATSIYQLNIQLFPVTTKDEGSKP